MHVPTIGFRNVKPAVKWAMATSGAAATAVTGIGHDLSPACLQNCPPSRRACDPPDCQRASTSCQNLSPNRTVAAFVYDGLCTGVRHRRGDFGFGLSPSAYRARFPGEYNRLARFRINASAIRRLLNPCLNFPLAISRWHSKTSSMRRCSETLICLLTKSSPTGFLVERQIRAINPYVRCDGSSVDARSRDARVDVLRGPGAVILYRCVPGNLLNLVTLRFGFFRRCGTVCVVGGFASMAAYGRSLRLAWCLGAAPRTHALFAALSVPGFCFC